MRAPTHQVRRRDGSGRRGARVVPEYGGERSDALRRPVLEHTAPDSVPSICVLLRLTSSIYRSRERTHRKRRVLLVPHYNPHS